MSFISNRKILGVLALIAAFATTVAPLEYTKYFAAATTCILAIDQFLNSKQEVPTLPNAVQ